MCILVIEGLFETIVSRRSIRRYRPDEVARELIDTVFAGRRSGHPRRITVSPGVSV